MTDYDEVERWLANQKDWSELSDKEKVLHADESIEDFDGDWLFRKICGNAKTIKDYRSRARYLEKFCRRFRKITADLEKERKKVLVG